MDLPRHEIAFRKRYETLVLDRSLTVVFRPGNRIYPNRRGYKPGEIITARIIEKPGCDERRLAPLFNDHRARVIVSSIEVMSIASLTAMDFEGSSPDVQDICSLQFHLKSIYGYTIDPFDGEVTRIKLEYI